MQVYISRNGRTGGPYSVDQVRRFLADNTLFAEDSAWVGSNPDNVMPLGQLLQGHQPNDPPVLTTEIKN